MTEAEWLASDDPQALIDHLKSAEARRGWLSCKCCRVRCDSRYGRCPAYRKLRLFAVACCRRVPALMDDPVNQRTLRALEGYLEGGEEEVEGVPEDHGWRAVYLAVHQRWLRSGDDAEPGYYRWWIAGRVTQSIRGWVGETRAREAQHALVAGRTAGLSPEAAARLAEMLFEETGRGITEAATAAAKPESGAQVGLIRDIFGNPLRTVRLDRSLLTPLVASLAEAAYGHRELPSGHLEPARLAVLSDALEEAGVTGEILDHLHSTGPHVRGCWAVDLVRGRS
jgi:hypothetical protein